MNSLEHLLLLALLYTSSSLAIVIFEEGKRYPLLLPPKPPANPKHEYNMERRPDPDLAYERPTLAPDSNKVYGGVGKPMLVPIPAPVANVSRDICYCQCKKLKYRDDSGQFHGNCVDYSYITVTTLPRWCYVEDEGNSTCPDLVPSRLLCGEFVSNIACGTPPRDARECRKYSPWQ